MPLPLTGVKRDLKSFPAIKLLDVPERGLGEGGLVLRPAEDAPGVRPVAAEFELAAVRPSVVVALVRNIAVVWTVPSKSPSVSSRHFAPRPACHSPAA